MLARLRAHCDHLFDPIRHIQCSILYNQFALLLVHEAAQVECRRELGNEEATPFKQLN
jgi:hypothetical protein